ncbi:MAG: DUF2834 domain-containing protein [Tunicatimonas sp.]
MIRIIYVVLCVLGTLLPLSQLAPWLSSNGLATGLLVQEAFSPPVAAFAWWDVIISALVTLVFVFSEGRRLGVSHLWLPVLGLCTVGVSLALPLFLLQREQRLIQLTTQQAQ